MYNYPSGFAELFHVVKHHHVHFLLSEKLPEVVVVFDSIRFSPHLNILFVRDHNGNQEELETVSIDEHLRYEGTLHTLLFYSFRYHILSLLKLEDILSPVDDLYSPSCYDLAYVP
jgi:hypothetical protein